jgi:hypothetical protein
MKKTAELIMEIVTKLFSEQNFSPEYVISNKSVKLLGLGLRFNP